MKVAGRLPVHNAGMLLPYAFDYYLNHEHLDAVCVIDCGSFDGSQDIVKSCQDKRMISLSVAIDQLHRLPELITQLLKILFLKRKCEWVLPLHPGEFFSAAVHIALKQPSTAWGGPHR